MGLQRYRTITLLIALLTFISNTLSSLLFAQLPEDPYYLASNFGWYLHFANLLSVFGFVGAARQHALSISLFSNYLLLDTLLSSIPRFLLLTLLSSFSSTLCSPSSQISTTPPSDLYPISDPALYAYSSSSSLTLFPSENESTPSCKHLLSLLQLTLGAGILVGTVLQFIGALQVREYARRLWVLEEGCLGVEVGEGNLVAFTLEEGRTDDEGYGFLGFEEGGGKR